MLATQFSFVDKIQNEKNQMHKRLKYAHDLPFVMIQSNLAKYKQLLDFSHINDGELAN